MTTKAGNLLIIVVFGIILADIIGHAAGTTALFSGLRKIVQIIIDPTNTKGL